MTTTTMRDDLTERAVALVDAARRSGADAADAVVVRSSSLHVSVRLGKVENTASSKSDDLSLRVFVDGRVAAVSAPAEAEATALAARAVAMARVSPRDPFQGLAERDLLAAAPADLGLFDETAVPVERLTDDALAAEAAALDIAGVSNSAGASASSGTGGLILATSDGFVGHYQATRFSRSVSVIAGEGTDMERDYDYSSRLHFADLADPGALGREAGQRAVRRLNARQVATGRYPVVFDPRVARGVAGHLAAAINGAAVARKTSFLRDLLGQMIAAAGLTASDDPLRQRGLASRPFDGEGVAGRRLTMVEDGVLCHWLLSSSAARQLQLSATNGRGARGASSVNPAPTNFAIEPGTESPEALIGAIGTGFYVTEVFGQGVDLVTGDYSRGAAGFWIENGTLSHPVSEVTIASNLKDMFLKMTPASDLDRDHAIAAPTLLVEEMIVAGT